MPKDPKDPQVVTPEQMVADAVAKLKTVETLPQNPAPQKPAAQNGAFAAKDGRILYRYDVAGTTYILPKPIEEMTEDEFYKADIGMMNASPNQIPHDLYVKFKDPQWAGQWFNHKAGRGQRVGQARSMGFVPAKAEDCEWYAPHLNDKDGALENGDLVLMKIHKAKLYSMFRRSMEDAKYKGGIMKHKDDATAYMHQAGVGQIDPTKLEYYHTPQALQEFQGLGPVTQMPTVGK